ncbi:MAG: hypothetical protein K2X38_20180 [Gemmataceae bacterium]|nr:hypothetical protein [Gemmataceae bacterium]
MRSLSAFLLVAVVVPLASAEELLRLRFGSDLAKTEGAWAKNVRVEKVGELSHAEQQPAAFCYDTLQQRSLGAVGSMKVTSGGYLKLTLPKDAFPADRSFTIEAFVKPNRAWRGAAVRLARSKPKQGECGIQPVFYPQFGNQYYYGGQASLPGGERIEMPTGEFGSNSFMNGKDFVWRHVAMTYDAKSRTIAWHTDYFMTASRRLTADPQWGGETIYVGGAPDRADFDGQIAELRVTDKALSAADFLRFGAAGLANPNFASTDDPLPPEAKIVNVKTHFGAVGDGKHDDTIAIQSAFDALQERHAPGGAHVLHFPAGEYQISDKVQWTRFLTVRGAGPGKTILRLKDHAKGFADRAKPKPMLVASSTPGPAGSEKFVNGSSIANWLIGFTLDTGRGNPGAKGIEFHSNNMGSLVDIHIRSGDGAGYAGLDLTRRDCGPALYKNVTIDGFDVGVSIRIASQEYGHTFEHLTLRNQRKAGLENYSNILAIRGLRSENKAPAVICSAPNSMLTLIDSDLRGGADDAPAVVANGGLYIRNLTVDGYKHAVRQTREKRDGKRAVGEETKHVDERKIDELVGGAIVSLHGEAKGSLKLSIQDPPAIPWGEVQSNWVAVASFKTESNTWADALEAAMATGKPNVVFGRGHYDLTRPVKIAATVRRIHLASAGVGVGKKERSPAFIIEEGTLPLAIEHGRVPLVEHRGPRTLILRHGGMDYVGIAGAGDVFIEDIVGASFRFAKGQHVWARQWNVEAHGDGPCVVNDGAVIWVLGFKTEYESEKIDARPGSITEILGGFIYPIGTIPPTRPIFRITDAQFAAVYGTSVYAANHKVHIVDTQKGVTREMDNSRVLYVGSRGRVDLYVSNP